MYRKIYPKEIQAVHWRTDSRSTLTVLPISCRPPKAGDVVAFLPNGNENSHYYIKRVVAGPGDKVRIADGTLYVNGQQILEADKDPSKYPNLVVRVTGFTAYFCSLTPEFRKLVVDRILIQG